MRLDFDKGIELYNKKNPNNKISRKDIYKKELTRDTIQKYKRGKIPKVFKIVYWFLEKTGLELKDILIKNE